jgi:hypothetical protein
VGLAFGGSLGGVQWLALRRGLPTANWWVPASGLGAAAGGLLFVLANSPSGFEIAFIFLGLGCMTVLQWLVLWVGGSRSWLWLVANPLAWLLGVAAYFASSVLDSTVDTLISSDFFLVRLALSFLALCLCLGASQAWLLRRIVSPSPWIGATVVGLLLGPAIASLFGYLLTTSSSPLGTAIVVAAFVWTLLALLAKPLLRRLTI